MTHHAVIPGATPGHADQASFTDRLAGLLGPAFPGALCAQRRGRQWLYDPSLWFPNVKTGDERNTNTSNLEAVKICRHCPVWQQCRDYALDNHPLPGIWGGTTEQQRSWLRGVGQVAT